MLLQNSHYYASAPIDVVGLRNGHLILYANTNEWALMKRQVYELLALLIFSLIVLTLLISVVMRFYITKPLSKLSGWATMVSTSKDFDSLAIKDSDDEVGELVDSLNLMLTELSRQASIVSLNERLQEEIVERTKAESDLIEMRNRAESASEAKSRFLANMSHEIRTPMNAIIGFIDVVLESKLQAMQRKHLETVRRSASLLHALLNDILDVSKLEEGKLQLESVAFSMQNLIDDVTKTFEIKAKEKGLQLGVTITPSASRNFLGDPLRLSQVLNNLVGNAIKFTETGGVYLEIDRSGGDQILFKVIDTGIGIPKNKQEHIFQNFAQADSSVSRKYGGSGLGTTIAKQLVELMGGKIWLESDEGSGSIFYFTVGLPITTADSRKILRHDTKEVVLVTTNPLNILVAEDVEENAELLRVRLCALGHHIDTAKNGNEAVHLVKTNEYDIILMDVQMPEKDGLTAAQEIRALNNGKDVPILALTASVLRQNRMACMAAGMNGFVTKPIVFADLFSEMARVLESKQASVLEINEKDNFVLDGFAAIDGDKAAALWKDKGIYLRNLKLFVLAHRDAGLHITDAIRAKDFARARKILHALRGASGNLALVHIYQATMELSDALRQGAIPLASQFTQKLSAALDEAEKTILQISENEPESVAVIPSEELSQEQREQLAAKIQSQLKRGETADADLRTLLNHYLHRDETRALAMKIEASCEEFEFLKASELLGQLVPVNLGTNEGVA